MNPARVGFLRLAWALTACSSGADLQAQAGYQVSAELAGRFNDGREITAGVCTRSCKCYVLGADVEGRHHVSAQANFSHKLSQPSHAADQQAAHQQDLPIRRLHA